MTLVQQLITVCDRYCEAAGIRRSRLSTLLFSRGTKIDDLATKGRDLGTATFEAAMAWLSQNWPEGTQWPDGIDRPHVEAAPEDGGAGQDSGSPLTTEKDSGDSGSPLTRQTEDGPSRAALTTG